MKKPERIYLGDGVAIQLRGHVWWLDIYRKGKRSRQSLRTANRKMALMKAITHMREGCSHEILEMEKPSQS